METFEINSILRLLRSSIKYSNNQQQQIPNPAASLANFIASGQRFEILKKLRRQLRRHLQSNNNRLVNNIENSFKSPTITTLTFTLIQSIFDILKQILTELVVAYFENVPSKIINNNHIKPLFQRKISVNTVYAAAVQKNEILEILQILIEIVQKCPIDNLLMVYTEDQVSREKVSLQHQPPKHFIELQEYCYGRAFLPEVITLLGMRKNVFIIIFICLIPFCLKVMNHLMFNDSRFVFFCYTCLVQ